VIRLALLAILSLFVLYSVYSSDYGAPTLVMLFIAGFLIGRCVFPECRSRTINLADLPVKVKA
jgi:hypothetical protein